MSQSRIRNFCIVAHIDHGKSTLADRLIEATGAVEKRQMREQITDTMDLERERGITIKLNAVRMSYTARDGSEYELNLIDTPGHVDFTYEVSRSLAACEGAILVVDASQGVQAQTLSNLFLAMDAGLEIIPVLNKIDLPGAEPEKRAQEIMDLIGSRREEILAVSAKEGTGVPELLEAIVARVPPPRGKEDAPLRALIFDSYYDRYRGAIPSIRVVDGAVREGMEITFGAHPDDVYQVDEVGYLQLGQRPAPVLEAGEVGYLVASLRDVRDARVGDTILDAHERATELLPGYREVKSMVFAGLYPTDSDQYEGLRDALEKLRLNDASLQYEPESSTALGFGFRCGFLGLLHMEIVQERLERDHGPRRLHRRHHEAGAGAARGVQRDALHRHQPGRVPLRLPAGRDRPGLLRQAEVAQPGLRVARLRDGRLPRGRPGEARHAHQRRSDRRLQRHHSPRQGAGVRPQGRGEAEGRRRDRR